MIIIKREDIRWGEMGATYLYGSQIVYHKDGRVTLKNPLLASGETLKTWFSSVNYQATRNQPSLPLLKKNHTYRLSMKMQVQPTNGLYLKLTFLNRYEEIIEEKIERQFSFTFTYPETAYTYRLSLISAGFEALDFASFSIEEDAGV